MVEGYSRSSTRRDTRLAGLGRVQRPDMVTQSSIEEADELGGFQTPRGKGTRKGE